MERIATWENIGTKVNDCRTIDDVLRASKLDYEVSLAPVTTMGMEIPNRKATIATLRDGTSVVKGIVSDSYTVCQNEDAFNFIDDIGVDNGLEFVSAGETYGGLIYIISKLPSFDVFGDEIVPHIIFQNSHNGQYPLRATLCALRLACANQFASTFSQMDNTIKIYHTTSLEDRLNASRSILLSALEYSKHFKEDAEEMYSKKLSVNQVNQIFDTYLRQSRENALLTSRQEASVQEQLELITHMYDADDNQNFKGTLWGAANAFTDFLTHKKIRETTKAAENQFITSAIDPHAMNRFYNIARQIAA